MYATLARQVRQQAVERARRARWQVLFVAPLIAGVVFAYTHRQDLFGLDLPVRIAAVIALVVLGWTFARDLGRAAGPILFQRLEPGTAGTVGFLIRLVTLAISVMAALRLAGLTPRTVAVGGAITAVIFGLAAQQTLGNVIAGTVLVQTLLAESLRVPTRSDPHIALEEVDGDEVSMRVTAVPADPQEGPALADEVLAALHRVSRDVAAR